MKLKIENLIKIELLLSLMIAVFTIMEQSQWTSLCFAGSFLVLVLAMVVSGKRQNKNLPLLLVLVLLTTVMVLVSAVYPDSRFSLGSLTFFCVFVALLIYIYLMQVVPAEKDLCDFIMCLGLIMAAVYPVAYYFFGIQEDIGLLTMNFSNPNLLGMWLLQAVSFCVVGFFYYDDWTGRLLCGVLAVLDMVLLDKTGARNAMIALLLGAAVFFLFLWRKQRISDWVLAGVVVFPIAFLIIYLETENIWGSGSVLDAFMAEETKVVSSRYEVWTSSLYHVKNYWLTGNYFKLAGNTHNSHLVILCSYGAVVLVLTMVYLFRAMKTANRCCDTAYQKVCMIAFCVSIFMGNAEGALFSGAVGLYIPACVFLLLARYNKEKVGRKTPCIVLRWGESDERRKRQ